ncbi:MAG: FecR domain-containing protein [Pseudomonadota bacterium]
MTDQNIIPLPNVKKAEEEASLWIMRFDEGEISLETRQKFGAWYQKTEQNKQAYDRLSGLWQQLDHFHQETDLFQTDDDISSLHNAKAVLKKPVFHPLLKGAVAASFITCLTIIGYFQFTSPYASLNEVHTTSIGEQKTIELSDGSVVILNTNSSLEIDYRRHARHITLMKGEAFFTVAKSLNAPFVVMTDKGIAKALGTEFSVRLYEDKLDVVVREGIVEILKQEDHLTSQSEEDQGLKPLDQLIAGEAMRLAKNSNSAEPIILENVEDQLDWRDGILSFKGESLEKVIADVSRYTDLKIEIDGEDLRQQPIGGYFKVGETEPLFEALKIMANIDAEHISSTHIRLHRSE